MGDEFGGGEDLGGFGDEEGGFGDEEGGSEKPFDDEPFDADVDADETEDPKNYIQQLSGKLGQSLRTYEKEVGEPDFDLEKFAVNSVLSATNTGEMDTEDQKDIITKVKTSGLDNDIEGDLEGGEPEPEPEGDAFAGTEPEVEGEPEPEGEFGVEEVINEFGGPPEDQEYDTKQVRPSYGNSDDMGNFDSPEGRQLAAIQNRPTDGKSGKWGSQVSEEISIFEDRLRSKLNEGMFPSKSYVTVDNSPLGATIWDDSGSISVTLTDRSSNPHGGGNNDDEIFRSQGVAPEQFTKEFIIHSLTDDSGMGQPYVSDIGAYASAIDELLMKVQPMTQPQVKPEVKPKREVEEPKRRIKERDTPFQRPNRSPKTSPKAEV